MQGYSIEGGASKARRLVKMEVKIADVWSEESVGLRLRKGEDR